MCEIDLPRLEYILKNKVEIYKILELFLNNDELRSQMDKITRMFKVHTDSFYIGLNQAFKLYRSSREKLCGLPISIEKSLVFIS